MSPEHEVLCVSIFEDALTIINLINVPDNPFYAELQRTGYDILRKEGAIRAYLKEKGPQHVARDIGTVLSNQENIDALLAIVCVAEQTFLRAGLTPLSRDIAVDTAAK
jgi:hypothetical protein